jgi:hypothetical protein
MGIAVLLVALGSVGQVGYAGPYVHGSAMYPYAGRYGYGYSFGTPLPLYDPIAYYRYHNGAGFYTLRPTPVFPPKVITIRPPLMGRPGVTGRVVKLDEGAKTITLRLPGETVAVRYGSATRWRSLDDGFPEVQPGNIINVDRDTITILRRGDG